MNIRGTSVFGNTEDRGLTVSKLIELLMKIPNQEQRVMIHAYKDGVFIKEEVTDVCQGQLEVVII